MKDSHIYYKDGQLACSVCKDSEIAQDGFKRFKIHPILNKNIANPSDTNSDMQFWAECPTCRRQTKICSIPYLYY